MDTQPTCIQCGAPVPAGRREFCSKRCSQNHWRENNRERQRELQRNHYQTQKFSESRTEWQEKNAERLREYRREYYLRNKERIKKQASDWSRDNVEAKRAIKRTYNHSEHGYVKVYEGAHRRLARKAASPGGEHFTRAEFLALCQKYDFTCLCCRKQFEVTRGGLEPDHIQALAAGGSDAIWNIQPLCRNCNAQKGDRTVDYRPARYVAKDGTVIVVERRVTDDAPVDPPPDPTG